MQNEVSSEAAASEMDEEADDECEVEEQQIVEESENQCQSAQDSTLDCNESTLMHENQQEEPELDDGNVDSKNAGNGRAHPFVKCKICQSLQYKGDMKKHLEK